MAPAGPAGRSPDLARRRARRAPLEKPAGDGHRPHRYRDVQRPARRMRDGDGDTRDVRAAEPGAPTDALDFTTTSASATAGNSARICSPRKTSRSSRGNSTRNPSMSTKRKARARISGAGRVRLAHRSIWMRKLVDYRRREAEAMRARGERVPVGPSPASATCAGTSRSTSATPSLCVRGD